MSLPQIYFTRQEMCDRTAVPEDVFRYWLREGLVRPEHGGGKGRHWRFSRLELAVAVVLGELRRLGLSSAALSELVDQLHAAIDWMRDRRIDIEQAAQIGQLVKARLGRQGSSWPEILQTFIAEDWFDLRPSLVRLAETVEPPEWQRHHSLYDLLADISLRRSPSGGAHVWLGRTDDRQWVIERADHGLACIRLNVDRLNERVWSKEGA
jgi:DNA-binding transcriptional MerR regulator